ncbi:MAG: hypothetical protein WC824_15030 [Bacteroidota bacterium]|jgi:hypothetical protein
MAGWAKPWNSEEESLLEKYATGELSAKEISSLTGRTEQAVRTTAHLLGKTRTRQVWISRLSENTFVQITTYYAEGKTMADIQQVLHLSYHQVRWGLKKAGVLTDRIRATKVAVKDQVRVLSEPEKVLVRQRWFEGMNLKDIAQEIGCWGKIVQRFIKSENLIRDRSLLQGMEKFRRRFNPIESCRIVEAFTVGGLNRHNLCLKFQASWYSLKKVLVSAGIDIKHWVRRKNSALACAAYASGSRTVSPKAGCGKHVPHQTPFQGIKTLKSTTEALRAKELDAAGFAWFYEILRYPVAGHQYTPDFWITGIPISQASTILGSNPSKQEIQQFLQTHFYRVEDVKGWWGPKHPSLPKINAFRSFYPSIVFSLVVQDRKTGGWIWL